MILALETSCDETAWAVFDPAKGLAGEWVRSQIEIHDRHGGVVPDLAAREHLRQIVPLLIASGCESARGLVPPAASGDPDRSPGGVTQIAVTHGPGLAACLALGVAAAKALAMALNVPLAGVNHLRGHAWSPFISEHAALPAEFDSRVRELLPHMGLIVSGGHTLLLNIDAERRLSMIASTRDDAAGEALDKGAKLLGLGYPGGPLIEKRAVGGRKDAYDFPRGLSRRDDLEFSFSGLKTSLRYRLEKMAVDEIADRMADLCASYQQAVVDALARKVRAALASGDYRSLGLSGGVAKNGLLREQMAHEAARARIPFLAALPQHTGDNAGMIAFAAWADGPGVVEAGMGLTIDPSAGLEVKRSLA
jgi:N6-L-threonylcarbamoyladenine synthase